MTDRNGQHTHYTNESVIGNPTRITHVADATHIDYTYSDPNNPYHIHTVSDELSNVTTYTRDGNNRVTQIDYPDSAQETLTYNNFGQVLTHRRKNGKYEHAAYDNTGLLTKLWNPIDSSSYPPSDSLPHITVSYYGSEYGGAWKDRVKTVTYPANCSQLVATDTYEYDRAFDGNGVTNPSGSPVPGRGLVTKITHADTPTPTFKTFTYDKFGNKRSETDETNRTTLYTYDDYRRLKTAARVMPSPTPNQTTTYFYTPDYRGNGASAYSHTTNSVRKIYSPTNVVTGHTYDNNFRLASTIEAEGSNIAATTTFGYDNNGNQTRVTDALNHSTNASYDNRNRKQTVTDALNHVTTYTYQSGSNNVTDIQRPDGTHESKTYDAMHRVLTDTVPQTSSLNLTTWFTYNPSGTLHSVTDPRGSGPGDPYYTTTFAHNASDERVQMTYPNSSYRTWTYDDVHNLWHRRAISTSSTPGPLQTFTYDIRNRKKTMTWSNTAEWAWFDYDGASRLTTAINGTGAWNMNRISTVSRLYDAAGRLSLDQQNITGPLGAKNVNYTYLRDGSTRWLTVTGVSPTYAYMFDYDDMARFETITYAGSVAFQYHYDAASNERQRDNVVNGVTQFYTYDNLNRMTHVDVKKNNTILGSEDYGHDSMSRLVSVTRDDNKQDWFSYYFDSELKTANYGASPTPTASPGNPGSPNGQCADPVFSQAGGCPYALLVSTSTDTQGATIFYTADPNGFVTPTHDGGTPTGGTLVYSGSILVPAGSAEFISAVAYKDSMTDSNITQASMDNSCDLPAGADPNATPPPDAAPTPDTNWTPEATPPPYQADPNDPPPDVTPPPEETPPPDPPPVSDDTPPALDPGKEVKTVDDYISLKMGAEQMTAGVRDVTYNLDKMGNRQSVRDTGNTTSYTPNNLNEYSAVQGMTIVNDMYHQHELDQYGPVNNVVNYFYRNDEQLITAQAGNTTYQMLYDALGRCVKRTINGLNKYYVYDGERPILEYNSDGTLGARNVYGKGIDEILMRIDYSFPVTYYYQHDHEGSVIHLTDTGGNLIERYRYDVFGAPTIYPVPSPYPSPSPTPLLASAVSNRFMFTGREYAGAFGFYEYRARAYHPGLGRFTSEDPKLFDAGGYNLFRYCHNDPIDMTDPMGLEAGQYVEPPVSYSQWAQQLQAQARDLAERAQSTAESEHSFLGNALRQGFASTATQLLNSLLATGWTPIRSPNAMSHAHVTWGGETAPVYQSPSEISAKYRSKAYTLPNFNDPTGRVDPTGKIEINQTVTATRHMPYGSGPGSALWNVESRRVEFFRGVTGDANAAAQEFAFRGFGSIAAGIQAVKQSTYDVFSRETLEYQAKVDSIGDYR